MTFREHRWRIRERKIGKKENLVLDQKPRLIAFGEGRLIHKKKSCQPLSPSRGLVFLGEVPTERALPDHLITPFQDSRSASLGIPF